MRKRRKPAPDRTGQKVLQTEGLVKTYKHRTVVNHVDIEVRQGEVVGLLGPNGAGKTTTFYMVVGLVKPDQGRVVIHDGGSREQGVEDITPLPMHERARRGIGYLAQESSIFRKLTVAENILAILEMTRLSKAEIQARLDQLLGEFNVAHLAGQKAYTLSGGERRRVEIARALVLEPRFILLDEPFVGIDPIAVLEIQKTIRQLQMRGIGVLITDHNVRETLNIIDRAYIVHQGQVLLSGTAQQLIQDPQAKKIYLGEKFTL
jgi:lipopolysaccharide export system ATP-binding protein